MDKEKLKALMEALGNCSIELKGDFVLEKNVQYEVGDVAAGGIGIQINQSDGEHVSPSSPSDGSTPPPVRNSRKAGRPKSTLKDKMIDDADGCKLERLRKLMEGKKGKDAALIIFAAVKEGWMTKPSFTQVENEFGDIGSKANFNNYMNADKYWEEEIKGAIKSLGGCD